MVAGKEISPKDVASTRRLKDYWAHGKGAALINWGVPGDFNRCRTLIQEAVSKHSAPLPPDMIDGLCANLHREATGAMPGHAPGEEAAHAAKKAAKKGASS